MSLVHMRSMQCDVMQCVMQCARDTMQCAMHATRCNGLLPFPSMGRGGCLVTLFFTCVANSDDDSAADEGSLSSLSLSL
eukprot:2556988-Rhodomonas_salina.1